MQVTAFGVDIWDLGYVLEVPNITEQRTFRGAKLITNEFDITVKNIDNAFSLNNPVSFICGTAWLYSSLIVKGDNGETIWDGIITRIVRNPENGTATITSKNSLFSRRMEIIDYETPAGTWETAAGAFKNICDAIGFTHYDNARVNQSINDLENANCYLKVNINPSDNMTFQQAAEKLALYGNADAYSHLNNIYFVHWKQNTATGSVTIIENDMKALPDSITEDESQIINEFSIGYFEDQGIPATDAANNNLGQFSRAKYETHDIADMQSGEGDNQIIFKDLVSAVYIGEGYIKKTHKNLGNNLVRPLTSFNFNIFANNKNWLTLQTPFNVTLSDEAWVAKTFEPFEFTINEMENDIRIYCMERP